MSERNYAILGTGAFGGFYGAKLQKAGKDVHFLFKSDYEYVRHKAQAAGVDLPQINCIYQQKTVFR
ncbi:hypothetical protein DSM106972_084690 [Dulcicalothrix desertica PCC 7102]|uniref:Ketopantoate reductase N-terminal domain-containing protein n=1 Tax=Dulcicalothrix desertica PCC 7102 TaxID=232991 RepID=A0A3S1C5J7_9CYAN|nr:hypothetical protein DSM106972_084690 [Dulcicalothrix desertica PCC 7102]TWH55544.1 2-dehydropantoate 2-reductase [Dulcicalothrix desertica PCC 7102]